MARRRHHKIFLECRMGYPEILENHPFVVVAIVLEGDITLTLDGKARTYRAPQGVNYLVGRRPV